MCSWAVKPSAAAYRGASSYVLRWNIPTRRWDKPWGPLRLCSCSSEEWSSLCLVLLLLPPRTVRVTLANNTRMKATATVGLRIASDRFPSEVWHAYSEVIHLLLWSLLCIIQLLSSSQPLQKAHGKSFEEVFYVLYVSLLLYHAVYLFIPKQRAGALGLLFLDNGKCSKGRVGSFVPPVSAASCY